MTARDRIIAALKHKEPDKVPVDCAAMRSSGITGIAYNNLRKFLRIRHGETKIYDAIQQLAVPEQWYLDKFKIDVVDLSRAFIGSKSDWRNWLLPDGSAAKIPAWLKIKNQKNERVCVNDNDEVLAKMPESSYYFDQAIWPLKGIHKENFDDLKSYMDKVMWVYMKTPVWKDINKPGFYKNLRVNAKKLFEETDYAIMLEFGASLFEFGQYLYRTDEFLINLISSRIEMEKMLDKLTEIHLVGLERVLEAVSPYVQIIQMGDDLGMQSGPMISPAMYREIFLPRHKKIYRMVKDNTDMYVFLHSCGSVAEFIPDLIDAGVDILNPVQISAYGMEPEKLKREYGKDIVFWGGGIDTQHVLPKASPSQVRDEVRRNTEIFMKGGGFIFNQVHNILAGVPPENIIAMYDEVNKIYY